MGHALHFLYTSTRFHRTLSVVSLNYFWSINVILNRNPTPQGSTYSLPQHQVQMFFLKRKMLLFHIYYKVSFCTDVDRYFFSSSVKVCSSRELKIKENSYRPSSAVHLTMTAYLHLHVYLHKIRH